MTTSSIKKIRTAAKKWWFSVGLHWDGGGGPFLSLSLSEQCAEQVCM